MALIVSIIGITFAAFCMCLTVRIINRRERWAKWTAVGLVAVLVGYPVSMGPVIWLGTHDWLPTWIGDLPIYWPIQWLREHGPEPIRKFLDWYVHLWI